MAMDNVSLHISFDEGTRFGDVIKITCSEGYQIRYNNIKNITCLADGNWSITGTLCESRLNIFSS